MITEQLKKEIKILNANSAIDHWNDCLDLINDKIEAVKESYRDWTENPRALQQIHRLQAREDELYDRIAENEDLLARLATS